MADIFVTSKPRDVSKGGSRGDVFIFSHISVGSNPVHFQDRRRRHLARAKKSTYRVPRGRHVAFRQLCRNSVYRERTDTCIVASLHGCDPTVSTLNP